MKPMMFPISTIALALALSLAGCGAPKQDAAPVAQNDAAMPPPDVTAIPEDRDALAANADGAPGAGTAHWVGRWNGPEGLFLDIKAVAGKPDAYALTIKDNLDSQASYTGSGKGESIAFTRNGKAETLRAGSGDETGFKYLAGKQDCLIIIPGKEGYCRD